LAVVVLAAVLGWSAVRADTLFDPPAPAFRLPRHFTPQRYAARLGIDPAKPIFTGVIEITGTLDRPSAVIWLNARDLTIRSARVNGAVVATSVQDNLLALRGKFARGPVKIVISYAGSIATTGVRGIFKNEYAGAPYVYTYFEPLNARQVFPCIDEIDRKTPWQLTIDVPKGLSAVSNTPVRVEGETRFVFDETQKLPPYLVAFGVGPYEFVDAGRAQKSKAPLRIVTPRGTSARAAAAAQLLPRIIDYLEGFFEIPLPYPKLDVLVAPDMASGAMEHAGLITADSVHVLMDAQSSIDKLRGVALVIGHEASHQWLGDYVTPSWFEDTWLKEGFAPWMEHKVSLAIEPGWHDEHMRVTRRNAAFDADVLATARKIRQPIVSSSDIEAAFDAVTYTKGAAIIGVFERYVGEETFRKGLVAYLEAHAHGNASFADFVAAIEKASGKSLAPAISTFVDQPGVPELAVKLDCSGAPKLAITQRRYLLPGSAQATPTVPWKLPACFAFEQGGKRVDHCTLVDGATIAWPAQKCPAWVMTNAGGVGYYYTALAVADAVVLRDRAWPLLEPGERRAVFEDVRAQVQQGKLPVALLMSFVPKLRAMGDRFSMGDALGDRWAGELDGGGHGVPVGLETAIPEELATRHTTWVRTQYGPVARRAGFEAKTQRTLDDEVTRRTLLRTVAWAGDREITKAAVGLARNYKKIAQSTRELAMPIAANADPAFAAQLQRDVLGEQDRTMRLAQLHALAAIEDPKRAMAAYQLALDPKLPPEDVLYGILTTRQSRAASQVMFGWMRANVDKLVARFPTGDGSFAKYLLWGMWTCEAKDRDATVKVMRDVFGKIPNATTLLAQRIEAIDQCIAQRALVEPSMREWLRSAR
jgi:alanyl aminopeptidase